MISFSPKLQFQAVKAQRAEWDAIARSSILEKAITHSLAEMMAAGMAPDALAGVKGFIYVLQNLSEEVKDEPQMPAKRLTSYETTGGISFKNTPK